MRIIKLSVIIIGLLFSLFITLQSNVAAEEIAYLNELRQKYQWESIYLTYIPLSDMTLLLRNNEIVEVLSKDKNGGIISTLQSFLINSTNEIVLLQIDLKHLEAGYIRKDENNGGVTKKNWSQQDVFQVAYWCDRFLNENAAFAQLDQAITPIQA